MARALARKERKKRNKLVRKLKRAIGQVGVLLRGMIVMWRFLFRGS